MVKVLIVDDEPAVGFFLKSIVEEIPGTAAEVLTSPLQVVPWMDRHSAQVVFLDIDMPDMNGMELARRLRQMNDNLYIVFATAHADYALEAFELYSFDYILKPFNPARVTKTMQKLQYRITREEETGNVLLLEEEGRKVVLRPREIAYLECYNHKIRVMTGHREELVVTGDLQDFENRLRSDGFFRCHRSFLVNTSYIRMVARSKYTYDIIMNTGERVPLSRRQIKPLESLIKKSAI